MKSKLNFPTFFTGFSSKILTTLCLIVLFALGVNGQSFAPQPNENFSNGLFLGLKNVSGQYPTVAKLGNGATKINYTHQTGDTIAFAGKTDTLIQYKTINKKGIIVSTPVATIPTKGYFGVKGSQVFSLGNMPFTYTGSNKQIVKKVLKTTFGTYVHFQDETVATAFTTLYKRDASGNFSIPAIPSITSSALISDVIDFGDGANFVLLGLFNSSDFTGLAPNLFSNIVLYNPTTQVFTAWNGVSPGGDGTASVALEANSDTIAILRAIPSTFNVEVKYIKKGYNGYITIPNAQLVGEGIESFCFISKTNMYCMYTQTFLTGITKTYHFDGLSWSQVPGTTTQSSLTYNGWADFDKVNNRYYTNDENINTLTNVATANSTAVMDNYVDPLQMGGWFQNNQTLFTKGGLYGTIPTTLYRNDLDLTYPVFTIGDVITPSQNQVFPVGTTTVLCSIENAHMGDTLHIVDPNPAAGQAAMITVVVDSFGKACKLLNLSHTAQSGNYTYKLYLTDPSGNEGLDVNINFSVSSSGPTGVANVGNIPVSIGQNENNISVTANSNMDGYTVYSMSGQPVLSSKEASTRFDLSLENYPAGMYLVVIYGDNSRYTHKVLKK